MNSNLIIELKTLSKAAEVDFPAVFFCADRHKTLSARPHIPHAMWYISAPLVPKGKGG